jgi:hypothetical protein
MEPSETDTDLELPQSIAKEAAGQKNKLYNIAVDLVISRSAAHD